MNFHVSNRKKAALLAALLSGCLIAQPVFADEFTTTLTGGEDTVYAEKGIKSGETYTFTGDNAINIEATDENNKYGKMNRSGISIAGPGNYVINAGDTLAINVKGDYQFNKGIFYANSTASGDYNLTINGGKVVVEVEAGKKARGVETFTRNANITVNSALVVDDVKGNDEAFGVKATADSVINLNGDTIITMSPGAKNTAALFADSDNAVINVNYKDGSVLNPGNTVQLTGDIYTLDKDDDGVKSKSSVNVALTTPESFLEGVSGYRSGEEYGGDDGDPTLITYGPGESNLILANGARWTNKRTAGNVTEEWGGFKGSHVTTLTGGASAEEAGFIRQADRGDINVDIYSGHTKVAYEHEASSPATIIGGDFRIAKAKEGSSITLITDNTGISMEDKSAVEGTLTALAGKLHYAAFTSGERNLSGKVEIAEGLTGTGASLKTGGIEFKEADGQGQYVASEEPEPVPATTDAIGAPEVLTVDRIVEKGEDFALGEKNHVITGIYTNSGDTTKESPAKVDMAGHSISVTVSGNVAEPQQGVKYAASGAVVNSGQHLEIGSTSEEKASLVISGLTTSKGVASGFRTMDNASIHVTDAVKDVTIENLESKSFPVYGVYAYKDNGEIRIDAPTTLRNLKGGTTSTAAIAAVRNSSVVITAPLAVSDVKGSVLRADQEGQVYIAGGELTAGETGLLATVQNHGIISINEADADNGINPGKLVATGDIFINDLHGSALVKGSNRVSLNLSGADSSWTGMVKNDEGEHEFNLTLKDGATWAAKQMSDTEIATQKITNLTGDTKYKKFGAILMQDERPLEIDNISGNVNVYYAHDEATPTQLKGGDVKVGKAAPRSTITMVTDSLGMDAKSKKWADREKVGEVLSALASKLYYTGYTSGEKTLTGRVSIAEGLTASSASLRLETMGFKDENGQGVYVAPVIDAIEAPETFEEDRNALVEAANIDYGMTASSMYVGKDAVAGAPMIVDMNGYGMNLDTRVSGSTKVDVINVDKAIKVVNSAKKEIHLKGEAGSKSVRAIRLAGPESKLELEGPVFVDSLKTGGGIIGGIYTVGKDSKVIVDGSLSFHNMKAEKLSDSADTAVLNTTGDGSMIVVTGPVDISDTQGILLNAQKTNSRIAVGGGTLDATSEGGSNIAIYTHDGQADVNVPDADLGVTSHTTVIKGDVQTDPYFSHSVINIALTDDQSSWTGGSKIGSNGGGTNRTEVNLTLQNGATWNARSLSDRTRDTSESPVKGLNLTTLVGGNDAEHAGIIRPDSEETRPIQILNYSGNAKVFYTHDEADPTRMKGSDLRIMKAAENSGITLVTDNTGLNTDSTAKADKEKVDNTLNAMANKLYYNAYTTGERNLTGKVEIAEGLTATSASKRLEAITFKEEDGQGQYIATSEPEPELPDWHNVPITGNTDADADPSQKTFEKAGILKNGVYTFDKDTTLTAKDTASVVAPQDNVKINAAGHTLTMNQEGRTDATSLISEEEGKNVEITADKLVLDNRGTGARAEGIHLANMNEEGKLTVNGDTEITAEGKGYALGIYAIGKSTVTMNGKVKMNNGEGWAVNSGGNAYYDASAVYASGNMGGKEGAAKIALNDDIDLKVNANGLYANIGGASIDAKGGSIELNKSGNGDYSALMASNGTVNMNVVKDGSGNVTGADNHKVTIKGNVTASTSAVFGADKGGKDTRINLGLSTPDSSFTGVVVNQFPVEGKEAQGTTFTGETNLYLENGATWNNEAYGKVNKAWGGPAFAGSDVTNLNGGASADKAGFIRQKDENAITVRNYKGFTKVAYEHDAATPTTIKGGDFNVGKAAAGSGITLMTDNAGLNTASKADADKKLVTDTLTALAGKLKYEAYKTGEKNLNGKVEIAEGLTASSASLDTRDIVFTDEGVGTLAKGEEPGTGGETPGGGEVDPGTGGEVKPGGGEIEYGDKETVMMRGAKTALASSTMVWRNTNSDLQQRLGDVRLGREDVGIWAKYKGGKLSMDSQKTDLDTKYNSVSVGFDKEIGDNWLVGGAISHLTGDGTYREGTGDLKQTDFTAYGTRVTEDGQYLDLVAKVGQLKNDFHVVNEMGHKLDGDYKANGMSFSVEYGKRFVQDNGFYIDPSVQFTVGRIGGKDFDAASDFKDGKGGFKSMHIQQDAFTSSVGRLGLTVGQQADNYNAFAKMVLAHEFSGAFDTAFSAEGEAQGSKTHLDLKDTWFELEVGGSAKISETSYLYGSFARSMGGDVTNKWRVDAGVRFSF